MATAMSATTAEKVPAPPPALALRLVSLGLGYPDAPWAARFEVLLEAARQAKAVPAPGQARLERALRGACLESLAAEHFRLFGPAPACTLELAFHLSRQPAAQARKIADIAGFYKAFGVEAVERADSLPVVVEFLAYLEVKRARAELKGWRARREIAVEAAAKLRRELVLPAVEAFTRKLHAAYAPRFYLELAALCRSLLGGVS